MRLSRKKEEPIDDILSSLQQRPVVTTAGRPVSRTGGTTTADLLPTPAIQAANGQAITTAPPTFNGSLGGTAAPPTSTRPHGGTAAPPTSTSTCCSTAAPPTSTRPHMQGGTLSSTSNNTRESSLGTVSSEPIVFGGDGASPGNFSDPSGVAVSADNKIYIADVNNKRVQVFSMAGVFLCLFPAAVPGRGDMVMHPTDVDIDRQGSVWVVGKKDGFGAQPALVVQYRAGLPVSMFAVRRAAWFPVIAVDARRGRIVVGAANEILMFRPDGTPDRTFRTEKGMAYITANKEGNIVTTDSSSSSDVEVFSPTGRRVLIFRTGDGEPRGVCTGPAGRIIVASSAPGRVDVFTARGEFVRTAANVTNPWGVAVGPAGDLVVTDSWDNIVTIFPGLIMFA
ncbi:TRIM2 [Branchiostoma lanceolatum]|uniref:TRIM2 protein n=1 Tax=Branchiostoma lanceolatum TaxID=7740 RepID=A0A8J9VU52_BRALA|nr:TRIM2 [Branchiostoma lanceolatum]